jgi:hypothetical protein
MAVTCKKSDASPGPRGGRLPDSAGGRRPASTAIGLRSRPERCWLRAAQLLQRNGCDLGLAGHAGGHRQYPVGAGEIAALTDRLARKSDSLLVVSSDKLGVGGDSVIDRGKRVARTQPNCTLRGFMGFLPAPAVG